MSDASANLTLPFLQAAQAQKHVTVNESLLRLDALVQLSAVSATTSAQPASPVDGSVYILPAGKTGAAWSAMADGALGYYRDGVWEEIAPREGWIAFARDADQLLHYTGSAWVGFSAAQLLSVSASDRVLGRVSSGAGAAEEVVFTDQAQQLCDDTSFADMRATLGAAADSAVVHNSGDETIAGVKTHSGRLVVSFNVTPSLGAVPAGTQLHLAGADGAGCNIFFDAFAGQPQWTFRRSNGTNASPTALASGDAMGAFSARGYGATGYSAAPRATIVFAASEAWSDSAQGAELSFRTNPNGAATTPVERFCVEQDGALTIRNGAQVLTDADGLVGLRSYMVGALPSAANAARLIYVSNESGGAVVAFSDGANWRRVTDRAVVS